MNGLGFHGLDPTTPRPPGTVRVLLTGGSVAKGQAEVGGTELAAGLARLPAFHEKRIEVGSLALGGFQQPQPLHALVHALSLGAELDLVLNLDGFNEVALPPVYQVPAGLAPYYPRDWQLLTGGSLEGWRERLSGPASWGSELAVLAWVAGEGRYRRQLAASVVLPEALERSVAVWCESSRLMHDVCRARGIVYLHFLQPNQYDPESPRLEDSHWRQDSPMRPGAQAGYPRLREAGLTLRSQGVPFVDLSQLFAADPAPMYGDDCCHYSPEGIRAVTAAMVETVAGLPLAPPDARSSPPAR